MIGTQCINCDDSPEIGSFPLCKNCFDSLRTCPPICSSCGKISCTGDPCWYPWSKSSICSFHARYLMVGRCHSVLKRWKWNAGPLFNLRVLKLNQPLESQLQGIQAQAIVPIPQSHGRAWQLGGSSSRRVADWLGQLLQLPVVNLLNRREVPTPQAQLNLFGRFEKSSPFYIGRNHSSELENILLVDDFMTSGQTLKLASQTISRELPETRIHAFILGLRPRLQPLSQQQRSGQPIRNLPSFRQES